MLYQQSERDMAQTALLTLDAMDAATSRAWLKGGHKIFSAVTERLLVMAGLKPRKQNTHTHDAKANRKALAAKLASSGAKRK